MKLRLLLILVAALVVTARGESPSPAIPADVQTSSSHLRDWLNTLDGKTEAELAAVIGGSYEKDTWKLQGKDELRIRYKFGKQSTLLLLFQGSKVVKAEIYVMSE